MAENTQPTTTSNAVDTTRPPGNSQRSNSENSNFRTSGSNSSRSSGYGGKMSLSLPLSDQKDNKTMEENAATASISNAVDSAYSQSNSRSLSSESSQCMRGRGSSASGSSGYGGKQKKTPLSLVQAEHSTSSGNSGEVTTIKNLKRSKNKKQKKKAKTKQSQSQKNQTTEPSPEAKSQETRSTNDKTTTHIIEPQIPIIIDATTSEEVSTSANEEQTPSDEQTAEGESLQKDYANDNKTIHEHNVTPMSSSETQKDKTAQLLDDVGPVSDESLDDLEVDKILSHLKVEQKNSEHRVNLTQESFCCAISMHDGVILSTTANLTESLGFPKDVWLGRAFIDFVHPKDRSTFASQITSRFLNHFSIKDDYLKSSILDKTAVYVLLRCYRGFDTCGFGVKNKPTTYKPFKLLFRKVPEMPSSSVSQDGNSALRIICAIALSSIYKVPDEVMKKHSAKFSTRHSAAGILDHIDGTSVTAIGYMPQDILGKSILDFFHPDDMMLIKTAHEMLVKNTQGTDSRVSSPPYRFLIKNGCYITLETEWTRVFNPWTRNIESVTGDHSVLRGPKQCDIFTKTKQFSCSFPAEIYEKCEELKKSILKILLEPVPYPSDSMKQQMSKRCQALASYMENFLIGVKRQELKLDIETECELAASEHGSVMLGEISPHHHSNHDDSKCSTETPPTYQHLNYFENLNRFFQSVQPTFVPNEFKSLPYQIDHVPTNEKDRMLSPIQQCGRDSRGSFNSSSDSPQFDSANSNASNNGNTKQPTLALTEAIVSQHTDQMEMQMVKNHRKHRNRNNHLTDKKKAPDKCYNNLTERNQPIKRSWANETNYDLDKNAKTQNKNEHQYTSNVNKNAQVNKVEAQNETDRSNNVNGQNSKGHAVQLWPPFSMNSSTIQNNHLETQRFSMSTSNPNGILQVDQTKLAVYPMKNENAQPNVVATNFSNPYTLHYIKNLMCQPRAFVSQNLSYPYPPITYQPLPMLQQKPALTKQTTGASDVLLEMLPIRMSDPLLNMTIYENISDTEPMNLTTTAPENSTKLQVQSWAKMKDESSKEIDASNSSFGSSFFDSNLRTDESWESDKTSKDDLMDSNEQNIQGQEVKKRGNIPYWMKNVKSTPDLVLRYQVKTKDLQEALKSDLRVLREISQPGMVNEQLDQLYFDLDAEGQAHMAKISLGDTPSNSSEDEENLSKKIKNTHYSKLSMIYEENAPVQPPVEM